MQAKRLTMATGSLILLAVLFIALSILNNIAFRGLRVDLTENQLYTLSTGTHDILAGIDEPINLYYFFSERTSRDIPWLRTYANRVKELLDEFVQRADGKLKLSVIDPLPFSEDEDRATQFGIQGIPVGAGQDNLYFGLAGTNAIDGVEVIPFLRPEKEAFLEYDISKLIYSLAHPKKPVIGLLSTLQLEGQFNPMSQQMGEPWAIVEQLRQLFDVRSLDPGLEKIDDDIDVLMIVHPKQLGETTLYAIDQYVLGGGKALIFVDPQSDIERMLTPGNPAAMMFADSSSNMTRLFDAWGVETPTDAVIGDSRYALSVNVQPGQAPVPHVAIMNIDQTGLAHDDVITTELQVVNLATAGQIKLREGATTSLTPLISTTNSAMPIATEQVRMQTDPVQLLRSFAPTGEKYALAARIQGPVKTAFPDGPPSKEDAGEQEETTEQSESQAAPQLLESQTPINVIIVADTDFVSDRLWVRVQDFFGQRVATAWANNADFVSNALDNLTGNSDLISIRGQAVASRPFTTVAELEREANARFLATEQELMTQLQETEQRLSALQQNRNDDNPLILSPEQRTELERFQQKKLEIRKELRQVRHELDRNIEQLGTTLKVINIGLMPLILSIAALAAWWWRSRQRNAAQQRVAG